MLRSKLLFAALSVFVCVTPPAFAQDAAPDTTAVQQLQWSAVDVTAAQFKGVRDLAVNALGMHILLDKPNFAVLAGPNSSLFEIYGPGSQDYPWRHGQGGMAVGWLTADLAGSIKKIQAAGGVLLGDIYVFPHVGENGGDYAYQLFRAADGRVYAIAQSKDYHAK